MKKILLLALLVSSNVFAESSLSCEDQFLYDGTCASNCQAEYAGVKHFEDENLNLNDYVVSCVTPQVFVEQGKASCYRILGSLVNQSNLLSTLEFNPYKTSAVISSEMIRDVQDCYDFAIFSDQNAPVSVEIDNLKNENRALKKAIKKLKKNLRK